MPPAGPETARWFETEERPHESELRGYLRARFPEHLDIGDLAQETYARLLQAREQHASLRLPKACVYGSEPQAGEGIAAALRDGLCSRKGSAR